MTEPARHFLGGFQNEGVRAWCSGLEQAVLPIVDLGVQCNFAQIAAQQGQMMFVIDAANAAYAFHSLLVIKLTNQRIAGISRQGDNAATEDDLRGLLDQPQLWIVGMNLKKLAHAFFLVS